MYLSDGVDDERVLSRSTHRGVAILDPEWMYETVQDIVASLSQPRLAKAEHEMGKRDQYRSWCMVDHRPIGAAVRQQHGDHEELVGFWCLAWPSGLPVPQHG